MAGSGFDLISDIYSNQRPLDSQSDSLPNTNTEYRIETKTLFARLQHSFYTIRNETKTKTDKHRGAIFIDVLIYIANYSEGSEQYYVSHKEKKSHKH